MRDDSLENFFNESDYKRTKPILNKNFSDGSEEVTEIFYGKPRPVLVIVNGTNLLNSSTATDVNFTDSFTEASVSNDANSDATNAPSSNKTKFAHTWGVLFTVLGTVLLDFDADSCQSPARAYLLDVTLPGEKS